MLRRIEKQPCDGELSFFPISYPQKRFEPTNGDYVEREPVRNAKLAVTAPLVKGVEE